jgi:hypothetical protein
MGSATRRTGGIAAATLIMAGMPVMASTANARQVVHVPCSAASLVTAINAANAAGSGTLLLASGCTYQLTAAAGTGRGPDGLPVITGNIALIGGRSTRITRSSTAAAFRILEVAAGAVLRLQNLFVSGGNAAATVPTNDTGGGILNSRGTLLLRHVTVSNNTADSGAGISNDSGRTDLVLSLVESNSTRTGGGGGGGLYTDGSLSIDESILRGNSANTNGGAIYNGQGGRTQTDRTTIEANSAGASGGGIYNAADGRVVHSRTRIHRNTATTGGGIFNAGIVGRVTLSGSLVVANTPNNCMPPGMVPGCVG